MRASPSRGSIVIGRFRRSKPGGWDGEINTLTIQRRVRLVPNDDRVDNAAVAFRVMLGWQHIGNAWERQSISEPPRDYLRVIINDPLVSISAVLFVDEGGETARLCWRPDPFSSDQHGGGYGNS